MKVYGGISFPLWLETVKKNRLHNLQQAHNLQSSCVLVKPAEVREYTNCYIFYCGDCANRGVTGCMRYRRKMHMIYRLYTFKMHFAHH